MCRARSQATRFSAGFRAWAATAQSKESRFRKPAAKAGAISEIGSIALDLLKNPDLREAIVPNRRSTLERGSPLRRYAHSWQNSLPIKRASSGERAGFQ